jgi:hypothetical protein
MGTDPNEVVDPSRPKIPPEPGWFSLTVTEPEIPSHAIGLRSSNGPKKPRNAGSRATLDEVPERR